MKKLLPVRVAVFCNINPWQDLRYIRRCDMPKGAIYLLMQMRKNEKGRV